MANFGAVIISFPPCIVMPQKFTYSLSLSLTHSLLSSSLGHSYIILFSYGGAGDSSSHIVYFWQGRNCSKNEKGTSAALAMNIAKKMRGATQIRVVQNKEPPEFLRIFKGRFILRHIIHSVIIIIIIVFSLLLL